MSSNVRNPFRIFNGLVVTTVIVAGCQSPAWHTKPGGGRDHEEFGAQQQAEWDELNEIKADLRWRYTDPVEFDFPEHGEITVRDWHLEGGPGWEYVRARFTYRNTTDKPMDNVRVVLAVLDQDGEKVAASRVKLKHPWGLALVPGTFYSDEVKVPTLGAHRSEDGWHWTIECEAVVETTLVEWEPSESTPDQAPRRQRAY